MWVVGIRISEEALFRRLAVTRVIGSNDFAFHLPPCAYNQSNTASRFVFQLSNGLCSDFLEKAATERSAWGCGGRLLRNGPWGNGLREARESYNGPRLQLRQRCLCRSLAFSRCGWSRRPCHYTGRGEGGIDGSSTMKELF